MTIVQAHNSNCVKKTQKILEVYDKMINFAPLS